MKLLCNEEKACRIFEVTGARMLPVGKAEQLAQLLRTGRTRGHVLYEEIDEILAPGRDGAVELDAILSELTMNHIEVIDEPRTEDSVPNESFFDQEDLREDFGDSKPLRLYLRELLTVPRLTMEEEKELAKRVQEASTVTPTSDTHKAPRPYATDENGAAYPKPDTAVISQGSTERNAEKAEKRLIEANLWIALGTAMHFLNRGLSPIDLIQEGNIGLMRAAKEYNHRRAYRFSTYATWWVRKAIIQSLPDYNGKQTE
jgi:RNA polymerase primary sigma factor